MKIIKALFSRTVILAICALAEIVLFMFAITYIKENSTWLAEVLRIVGLVIAIAITSDSRHLSFDIMWFILIMVAPITGTALYILLGFGLLTSQTTRNLKESEKNSVSLLVQDENVFEEAKIEQPENIGLVNYLSLSNHFPIYANAQTTYYPFGQDGFRQMIDDLKDAKKFIFIEYFIIEEGIMWNKIHEILKEKAKEDVIVRVIYDDVGSFHTLSAHYAKKLQKEGIDAIPFNRVNPLLNAIMNHRDHRKICVIDGIVAYTGGVNLADEYINKKERFGVWKDNVIRLTGDVVWSMTVLFLSHWHAFRHQKEDSLKFKSSHEKAYGDGYVCVYGETPLDTKTTAQDVYLTIINQALSYCWIMTPYLIIDNDMLNALILAAQRGVDVKIICPGIPDKKVVYGISKSFFSTLIKGGVKIYTYTPGFVHSKTFISDDVIATVGTINLDYRSLYLHFENGTLLMGCQEIYNIKNDFVNTLLDCHEVNEKEAKQNLFKKMFISVVKLFSSQM